MGKNYKIYAIIVTYNGSKWVKQCFDSLIKSSIPMHIIALDNGSSDNTPEMIKANFPEVRVIETGENLGFGKANNLGIKIALNENADYCFLLNQDAWIETNTIETLINSHLQNSTYGILSPVEFCKPNILDNNFKLYYAPKKLLEDLHQDKTYETYFVNAAAWLVPVSTIKKIGYFDSLFNHYGEDEDFCFRAKYFGYKIGVVGNCIYYHDRPQTDLKNEPIKKQFYHFKIRHMLHARWAKEPLLIREMVITKWTFKFAMKCISEKNIQVLLQLFLSHLKLLANRKRILQKQKFHIT